jgi:hypothetical protein
MGLAVERPAIAPENQQTLDQVKRIWNILRETQGFDQTKVLALIPRLLSKPETQRMGQQIVGGLAQRVATRLLRELLAQETASAKVQPVPTEPRSVRIPALPASR